MLSLSLEAFNMQHEYKTSLKISLKNKNKKENIILVNYEKLAVTE